MGGRSTRPDVLAIHDAIAAEYPNTEPGVLDREAIEYVESGTFDDVPSTIHGKAFHLLRLLVANHPFVDGNKRTALNTVAVFYYLNSYRFSYDEGIRDILKRLGSDEADVERPAVIENFPNHVEQIALEEAVDEWRDDFLAYGVQKMLEGRSDSND